MHSTNYRPWTEYSSVNARLSMALPQGAAELEALKFDTDLEA
jgi:hypothetical protein